MCFQGYTCSSYFEISINSLASFLVFIYYYFHSLFLDNFLDYFLINNFHGFYLEIEGKNLKNPSNSSPFLYYWKNKSNIYNEILK
jgi:hypothetical protein